jgi:hypothetical protein
MNFHEPHMPEQNDAERTEAEILEQGIGVLQKSLLQTYLFEGERLVLPITEEKLFSLPPVIVVETNALNPEIGSYECLQLYGNGEWGSESGVSTDQSIDSTLHKFALAADPGYQELDTWFWGEVEKLNAFYMRGAVTDEEQENLEKQLENQFTEKTAAYVHENKLSLLTNLYESLENTLARLKSSTL